MRKIIGCFLGYALLFGSCSPSSNENVNDELSREVASVDSSAIVIPEEMIDEMIHSIPSPIELSSVIINSGAEFSTGLINDPSNYSNYFDDYAKALNLGVYGLDLGYMDMYGKTIDVFEYVNAINHLANDLKVGHFFDMDLLKRLSSSSENLDSLMNISTNAFRNMSGYLRQNQRGSISIMILAGSWIEGLHLAVNIAQKTSNQQLIESVGEQKMVLDNLIILLNVYKNEPRIIELLTELEKLKEEYNKVTISTVYQEPVTKEIDGVLVVEDNSHNIVTISDEQVKNISSLINAIRSKIIS